MPLLKKNVICSTGHHVTLFEEECLYEREDQEEDAGHFFCWIENSANSHVNFGWLCRVLVWSDLSDVSRQWKVFQNLPPEGRTGKLGKADSRCVSLPFGHPNEMGCFCFFNEKGRYSINKNAWFDWILLWSPLPLLLLLRRIAYVKRLGTDEKLEFMKTQMIAADMMRRGYQASKKRPFRSF